MNIGKTIAEYLLPMYQVFEKDSPARKSFLTQALGSLHEFEKTDDFLDTHEANGIDTDKLNKKIEVGSGIFTKAIESPVNYVSNNRFKNMLAKFLHDNPHAEHILKEYIQNLDNKGLTEKQIDNRIDLVKDLSSIGKLLKADPYNEPQFAKDVLSAVIRWSFDGNQEEKGLNEEVKILRKSLNNFINKDLISDFINGNSTKRKAAREVMELINLNGYVKQNKCTVLASTAGFGALAVWGIQISKDGDFIKEMFEPIKESLGSVPSDLTIPFIGSSPEITKALEFIATTSPWAAPVVTTVALYIIMKTIAESYKKLYEYKTDKQIGFSIPEKYDQACTTSILCTEHITNVMYRSPYDLTDAQSKKHLILTSFVMEKANNPLMTVSPILKTDLGLSNDQVKKLNALTRENIQELSFIKNLDIKSYLLLNNVTSKEKEIFCKISLIEEIAELGKNYDGIYSKSASTIVNISSNLKTKLNTLPANQKKIAECYLNLHRTKDNTVSKDKLDLFERDLSSCSVFDIIQAEIEMYKRNTINKEEKNKQENSIVIYAKRLAQMPPALWDHYIGKTYEKEKINIVNNTLKEELSAINSKYGFTKAQEMNDVYWTFKSKIINGKEKAIDSIAFIRAKSLAGVNKVKSLIP